MTDKPTVEIPTPVAGTVVALNGKVGEKLAVGSDLVVLETEAGEADPHPPIADAMGPSLSRVTGEGLRVPAEKSLSRIAGEGAERSAAGVGAKPLAAPAVRNRARDLGIDLHLIRGTGPEGRVTHSDVLAYAESRQAAPAPARRDEVEDVPITGLRRAIAEHLEISARRIPHFAYVEAVDVTAPSSRNCARISMKPAPHQTKEGRGHLTLLPFLMRAIVKAIVANT